MSSAPLLEPKFQGSGDPRLAGFRPSSSPPSVSFTKTRLPGTLLFLANVLLYFNPTLKGIQQDIHGLKMDIGGMKADMTGIKMDVHDLKVVV